jgi:Tol biopolymer transport system component/DNA-binding winged helix-turn-helix (wHTH) protein
MTPALRRSTGFRFGPYFLNTETGELVKNGRSRLRLQDQPRLVLCALLDRPGQLVSREEIYRRLWDDQTHVDFDHAVNIAIAKIRRVLNDTPDRPKYIETIPKKGYRFVGAVTPEEEPLQVESSPAETDDSKPAPTLQPPVSTEEPDPPGARRYNSILIAAVVVLSVALCLLVVWNRRLAESAITPPPVAFAFTPPMLSERAEGRATISPDGRHIVFVSGGGESELWVRDLDRLEARRLAGTNSARKPFWSPDSQTIGFATDYELKRVSVQGGPVSTVCELPNGFYGGGTWSPYDDAIVFSGGHPAQLYEVATSGGQAPRPWTRIVTKKGRLNQSPKFLPLSARRKGILLEVGEEQDWDIVVKDLESGAHHVLGIGRFPEYAPGGWILHQSRLDGGGIWALPFSAAKLAVTGAARAVLPDAVDPSVDRTGVLVASQKPGEPSMKLVRRNRSGAKMNEAGNLPRLVNPTLSPNGRVAFHGRQNDVSQIWLHESGRPVFLRLPSAAGHYNAPVWSPDGTELVYRRSFQGSFELYRRKVEPGSQPVLISRSHWLETPSSWSSDGKHLVFTVNAPNSRNDIWYWTWIGWKADKRVQVLATPADEIQPVLSPDSKWFAFCSDATGNYEVYVARFPQGEGLAQVSAGGGCQPRWTSHGNELLYVQNDTLRAVPVRAETNAGLVLGTPVPLFQSVYLAADSSDDRQYDVSPDGRSVILAERSAPVA